MVEDILEKGNINVDKEVKTLNKNKEKKKCCWVFIFYRFDIGAILFSRYIKIF